MNKSPRILYQPPGGRPRWISDPAAVQELQYLSWGWRKYGRDPIPASLHSGWIYQLVLSGRAIAEVSGRKISLPAGHLIMVGPGCPCGWSGVRPAEKCKILSWIWREPPSIASLRPADASYQIISIPADVARQLERFHRKTRSEIGILDEVSDHALHAIKAQIDVAVARSRGKRHLRQTPQTKIKHAVSWLEDHPEEFSPTAALSDYLQISPATLNRLFHRRFGENVRNVAADIRMKLARRKLTTSTETIKRISFQLGYSHPNDFTRAYTRFWKKAPSQSRSL